MSSRILVTGATGFIGAHVAMALLDRGLAVTALVRPGSDPWRLADVAHRIEILEGDPFQPSTIESDLKTGEFDAVCHLAWWGVGGRWRNDPRQIEINLQGTLRLVETCAKAGCRRFVGLGSQAEYGPKDKVLDETVPPEPTTLYGGAKLAAGVIGRLIAKQNGMEFAWLRVFSTYGPMDGPDWLIPSTILSLLRRERPRFTPGEQRWDYLYVRDLAEAMADAAVTPGVNGSYNLGAGSAVRVRDIVEKIRDAVAPGFPLVFGEIPYRPDQVMHLEADISKLSQATGWRPATPLAEGLDRTAAWFKERYA